MITQAELNQFTGTEHYYRSAINRDVVYTDGVQYLAEKAGAYWLIDKIASLQREKTIRADRMLNDMQFWTLRVVGHGATLICERDSNNVAYEEKIEWTDFPLPEVKLWVAPTAMEDGKEIRVIYLPSEH
jgi:hypothetical protein